MVAVLAVVSFRLGGGMRSGLDGRPGGSRSISQALQRFGSFRNLFSWWKRCSPPAENEVRSG